MNLDTAIFSISCLLIAGLIAVMTSKRVFLALPVFFFYLCTGLVLGLAALLVLHTIPAWYVHFVIFIYATDLIFFFGVIIELGKNLLRHNRLAATRQPVAILLFLITALLAIALAGQAVTSGRTWVFRMYTFLARFNETLSFAGFLTLATWSSLRKLRWPARELHVATGLGIQTFAWFVVTVLHSHWNQGTVYHGVNQAGQIIYIGVLAYWLHYFWIRAGQVSAARREPSMTTAAR
jgi:hypothetical protein